MKSFFKKSAISLVVLGLAGTAFAALPGMSGIKGYFLGVEGLDFQPHNGDLDYVTVYSPTSSGSDTNKAISPSYTWGFRVFAGLNFGSDDDVTLSWQRLHTHDSSSIGNPVNDSDPRWLEYDAWTNINSKVNFDLNDVTLTMGHTIRFNNPWTVRVAGGLEYAKLDSNMTVSAFYPFDPNVYEGTYAYKGTLDTKGIGPRMEFDANYRLPYGFSLFMDTNAALLVSTRSIALNALPPTNVIEPNLSFGFSDRHIVVPKLGIRLGVNYAYVFGTAGGEGASSPVLNVNAGWEADTYIHAIERPDANDSAYLEGSTFASHACITNSSSCTFTSVSSTKTSNFSLQGLFMGVNMNWM